MKLPGRERGAVLIVVIAVLAVVAALAQKISLRQGTSAAVVHAEAEHHAAQYLAEAGVRHALWRVRSAGSANYPAVIDGSLAGQGSYRVTISPLVGSPITVTSTGTTTGGTVYNMVRDYTVACAGKTLKQSTITTYSAYGMPSMIYEDGGKNTGHLNPRNNLENRARALFTFDLHSLPKNVALESAELMLNVLQYHANAEGAKMTVNRVTTSWEAEKVTWNSAIHPKKWTNPGGDTTGANRATAIVAADTPVFSWNLTPIVQGWINNSFANYGLLLQSDYNSSFNSSEFRLASATGSIPREAWPRLVVKWCE